MSKARVAVVTDSTAYLPPDLVQKHALHVIPQILNWEGRSMIDGVDIRPSEFYERLKTAQEMPTTSQPSAGQFFEFFSQVAETAESIVGIFISEHLSGTLTSARAAVEMMKGCPVEIVDSRSTSMGLGFIALAAARAAQEGLSITEVVRVARKMVPGMRVLFVVDTLEFLHRGGRIGGAQRLLGSALSIKPVLHLKDGRIEPLQSVRTKRKAIEAMLAHAQSETQGKRVLHAAVLDASAPEEARAVQDEVVKRLHPEELVRAELSPVIGTHTGPGMVGIAYYAEE